MGKRRILCFENCLMAITVQLCHVAITFQKGGKRGAKTTRLVGSSFPDSTSSCVEVAVWNHCHLPTLEGWWWEAQESLVPPLWWQWSCTAQLRSISSRAAAEVEGGPGSWPRCFPWTTRARLHRARVSAVLPRGAWWHHNPRVACSPTMEAGFSPTAFPISAPSSLSLHSPIFICSAEYLLFASLRVVMLKDWISYSKQSTPISQGRGGNR